MVMMKNRKSLNISELFDLLFTAWGPQHWWPGETPFEVAVGAVLTQNTAWTNVEKAICALKSHSVLDAAGLLALPQEELSELLRPAGYYHVKAGYLRSLSEWIRDRAGGEFASLEQEETATLRRDLLNVRGIGKETADSILLYAVGKPVFVVDAYTRRIAARLGLLPEKASYDRTQSFFTAQLPVNVSVYNEMHALLVRLAKEHCRVRPRCNGCPLQAQCPSATGRQQSGVHKRRNNS